MSKKTDNSLKTIEHLLERLLDELVIESESDNMLPIPTKTFLEMEELIGEKIYLVGLS